MSPTVKLEKDRTGYLIDGERVDGFTDRDDVPEPVRYRIAHWASIHTPDELTGSQRDLIEKVKSRARPAKARRARAQSNMLQSPLVRALWDLLGEDQQRATMQVDTVLGEGVGYPLTSGQLARLTDVEQNTIRRWGLPHTRDERGNREFGPAATVIAFAYKSTKQNSREFYNDIAKSAEPLHELRRSIALATHSAFASVKPPLLDDAVAEDLEELSREMAVLAQTFARAATVARRAGSAVTIVPKDIQSVPQAKLIDTSPISKLIAGMDLHDLGEEIAILDPTDKSTV